MQSNFINAAGSFNPLESVLYEISSDSMWLLLNPTKNESRRYLSDEIHHCPFPESTRTTSTVGARSMD